MQPIVATMKTRIGSATNAFTNIFMTRGDSYDN